MHSLIFRTGHSMWNVKGGVSCAWGAFPDRRYSSQGIST